MPIFPLPKPDNLSEDEANIWTLALLLAMSPAHRAKMVVWLRTPDELRDPLPSPLLTPYIELVTPGELARVGVMYRQHRHAALGAALFAVLTLADRAAWDRGVRDGFEGYADQIRQGHLVCNVVELIEDERPEPTLH